MTRATILAALGITAMSLSGCGILINVFRSHGAPGALNTFEKGPPIIAPICMTGNRRCESVAQVETPTDLEAWAVTYKEGQRAPVPYGSVPAGEASITLYIVGPRETCVDAEGRLASLEGTGVGMKSVSEPCRGPFYFKRDR